MLVDRIRRAYQEIAKVERVAVQFPDDAYVIANLNSLRHDVEELEREWAEESQVNQRDVCRYRMVPSFADKYSIRSVSQSLLEFQELFSQIYDALKNGAKKQARLGVEIKQNIAFNLAFTYPGSLGVAMSIDGVADFFRGDFDKTIDAVMQVVEAKDEHDVRDMAKSLGEAVVKRAYDWAQVNSHASYGIDLDWTTMKGLRRGGMIDVADFDRLVSVIGRTSDSVTIPVKVYGVLVGLDSKTKRFRFVDPDGKDYVGNLSESFPSGAVWQINEAYLAEIDVEETIEYAMENTRTVNRLKGLEPQKRKS